MGRHNRVVRVWQSLLCILWLCVAMAAPAHAALHEVVVVTQARGESREAARTQALTLAKAQAIARVARTLNPGKAQAFLGGLDAQSMLPMVRGATVLQETRVEDIYYAKVRVSVLDTPIRQAYGEEVADEVAEARKARRAILVLPVYYDGTEPTVWDVKKNPTFEMWREAGYAVGHGALMIPGGDPKERAIVDRDNVLTVPYTYLKPLLESYGTDEMAMVVVNEMPGFRIADPLEVVIRRVREEGQRVERFTLQPAQDAEGKFEPRKQLYTRAVKQAATLLTAVTESTAHLEAKAKRDAKQQNVKVQFTTLKEWARIERALREVEGFVALDTLNIGIYEANLILYVAKDVAKARADLMKTGLIVAEVDGVWRVRAR